MKRKKIMVIHGPNLNLLGRREPEVYGKVKLAEINIRLMKLARSRNGTLRIVQSNSEGAIIDSLHAAASWADGVVLNPGAYAHYSWAIHDAVRACGLDVIEVHLTNVYAREEFRQCSVIASACMGQISGFGWRSYALALQSLLGPD